MSKKKKAQFETDKIKQQIRNSNLFTLLIKSMMSAEDFHALNLKMLNAYEIDFNIEEGLRLNILAIKTITEWQKKIRTLEFAIESLLDPKVLEQIIEEEKNASSELPQN